MDEVKDEPSLRAIFVPFTNGKAVFLLFVIGFLVFLPTFFNGFVADDNFLVVNNALIHSPANLLNLFFGTLSSQGGQYAGLYYRPFMLVYFTILYTFFKTNPFLYHSFQLLICILNAVLLLKLYRYFFTLPVAFLLSLVFLIHPINVETVAWISGTNDFLFMSFGLIALSLSLHKRKDIAVNLGIVLSLLASSLSKETGLLFIVVLFLLGYLFKKNELKRYVLIIVISLIPYLLLKIGLAHQGLNAPPNLLTGMSLLHRTLTMPAVMFYYLKNSFLPLYLVMPQGWVVTTLNFSEFYGPLLFDVGFLIALSTAGFYFFKTKSKLFKPYTFFLVWLFVGLGLHMQIFPLDYTASDRWFYFPLAGLLGIGGVFLNKLKPKIFPGNKYVLAAIIIIVLALGTLSFKRTTLWNNGLALWSHDVTVSENNTELENALGYALIESGHYTQAEQHLKKSIALYPNASNWTNLGVAYVRLKKNKDATDAFRHAVSYGNYYLAYEDLALQLYLTGTYGDARKFITSALKKYPTSSRLWLILAATEYKQKNYPEALTDVKESYRLGPDNLNTSLYNALLKLTNPN